MEHDATFHEEQAALTCTYEKLETIARTEQAHVSTQAAQAAGERQNLFDELTFDLGTGVNLETYAEAEALQRVIDEYNLSLDVHSERLAKAQLLLKKPYFAKVVLRLQPNAPVRELYLGATGITDETGRHFIIDWRAPVAEVYYNQENGKTSYVTNGKTIEAELLLRRQFDITKSTLNAYFDTTVAIEDPLLLASLAQARSNKLSDITATIQREQNEVVRHADVSVLLVNGIAGSGKTSVMLQRIAYLLYRERETLRPDDVYILSPNDAFRTYIDNVLPNMGERNPYIITWAGLMDSLGLANRSSQPSLDAQTLMHIDEKLPSLTLTQKDFKDICVGDERVISAGAAFSAYQKFKRLPVGTHRCNLVKELLHERLEQRIASRSTNADVQAELYDLEEQEHIRLFGHQVYTALEEELPEYTRIYLKDRYACVADAIEHGAWLRIDRIGMNMLGCSSMGAIEWLYVKLALVGGEARHARYVMIDEVQDYSLGALMVLARYFCNAHFLLLGDENQAIYQHSATFEEIEAYFSAHTSTPVSVCYLPTSYRSSPEITHLFKSLMNENSSMNVASVQKSGVAPTIIECTTEEAYGEALRESVCQATESVKNEGLACVLAANAQTAHALAEQVGGELPVYNVATAKGLEFDHVIVADAQASVYGNDNISRHRLYTAISRATKKVTILSCGPLTPLLKDFS